MGPWVAMINAGAVDDNEDWQPGEGQEQDGGEGKGVPHHYHQYTHSQNYHHWSGEGKAENI